MTILSAIQHEQRQTKVLIASIILLYIVSSIPYRFAKSRYPYISKTDILRELVNETIVMSDSQLKPCSYADIIEENEQNDIGDITQPKTVALNSVRKGGEHVPLTCQTKHSVAIIVPYRQRPQQLQWFLKYFHTFLQHQRVHYQIFIVHQANARLFNRAHLLNAGAIVAMKKGFPCLVLHDIDLAPLNSANMYACTKYPRHMSSNLNTFRYTLPYVGLFGGAVAILSEQFTRVNGMSNVFDGWGGEDDNFYDRLVAKDLVPVRFDPIVSKYFMLKHKKQPKSPERYTILKKSMSILKTDGLNSFRAEYNITYEDFYTMINVYR